MSYTSTNYTSKKAVKDAIKSGVKIKCYNPGLGGDLSRYTGSVTLEGPHYPQAHKWYGTGKMVDGVLISIK